MTTPHSAQRPETEALLDKIGVTWRYDPDVPLHTIDVFAGLANQVRHEPLDQATVERYADAMSNGDVFPAVILVDDDQRAPLGGNHRVAARRHNDDATIAAYLVTGTPKQLRRIRYADNSTHGLPLTKAERVEHGIALMEDGLNQYDAAKAVGVSQPDLSIGRAALDADRRAEAANIAGFPRLSQSVRYQLSMLDEDDVFNEAASLSLDAALSIKHVTQIVAAIRNAEPVEALRFLGGEREDHAARIRDRGGKVRAGGRSPRAQLEGALAVIRAQSPYDVLGSCNADQRATLDQRIADATRHLDQICTLLKQK